MSSLLQGIRERVGSLIGAVLVAICFLGIGALLAFVISPQQAVEWRRIQKLPELDAAGVSAAPTGEQIAITGYLEGNGELVPYGFVAYVEEQWNVDPPDDNDDDPDGSWDEIEQVVPALNIAVTGGTVATVPTARARFGGRLDERLEIGTGSERATYQSQSLPEGSIRTRGLHNGDLVTVVGQKAAAGGVLPDRLFGGDRVELVQDIRAGARAAFFIGLALMICAPIVLVLGLFGGIFGKRRGRGFKVKLG